MPTTIQAREVTFASRVREQQVTIEPGDYQFANGRIVGETPGRRIVFRNGQYRTSNEEEIQRLRARIAAPDGPDIWELPPSVPASTDVLVELATANAERTRLVLDEERAGWQRPDVIAACEQKLAQFGTRGPRPKID